MQEEPVRRSNKERRETTRTALVAAARRLFVKKGYAETGTPEIVAVAKVTRGALYHHFSGKADIFRAVVIHDARAVAMQIKQETTDPKSGLDALMAGADAFFEAMAVPGRARLLLLDGPSVLGHAEMDQIDKETGGKELRQGLALAITSSRLEGVPLSALVALLSAAFDRAALAITQGNPADEYKAAIRLILRGLLEKV